jgi:hypothetical protein
MKKINIRILLFAIIWGFSENTAAQTILNADGPGNTYELINSVLAPNGGDVVESAECVHPEFGRHITEVWDATLNQYVFAFHIHVTPDNDRCINFDRQRVEIKTYDTSPANWSRKAWPPARSAWRSPSRQPVSASGASISTPARPGGRPRRKSCDETKSSGCR